MAIFSEFPLGDMLARYVIDGERHVGLCLIPLALRGQTLEKRWAVESLVQLHVRGDSLSNGYGNGHTMATTLSTSRMHLLSQRREGDSIVTTLTDGAGRLAHHRLRWHPGLQAVRSSVTFENAADAPLTLEMLSSVNLGRITPFTPGDAHGALRIHRARSSWSAEGRLISESAEALQLEPSWTGHAVRLEKFGQIGSMPVRGWFPFAAVEDTQAGVVWALQLACPSSWQIELRRKDEGLVMMAGLADADFGHWAKTLAPGESFESPEAYLTVGQGDVDAVAQRLLSIQRENWRLRGEPLPVLFNEYCTTWGNPTHDNLAAIAQRLQGKGIDYLVIDAGWYGKETGGWSDCGGDWIPNRAIFPQGMKATADLIRQAGMKPGLWFEPETCARDADIFQQEDMLLHRNGTVIDTDNRRFLDMRKPEVQDYLSQRVIGLLRESGFDYIKVDYNDCIGVGCDDPDGLGEGLRQNMLGTLAFFAQMRQALPELMIENCASGGHRLEPSLMAATDIASFSDAHECREIPIIAAALHRLILPGQSQIWAVLRSHDDMRRLTYSLINTFLGVMCLSGDITTLSPEQWQRVDEAVDFYRAVRGIIRDGVSALYGQLGDSWRHPQGWQAVVRRCQGQTLVVVHTFETPWPEEITLPVDAAQVERVLCSDANPVTLRDGQLTIGLNAPFQAVAVYLTGGQN